MPTQSPPNRTWQWWSLIATGGGLVLWLLTGLADHDRLWRAYLAAFIACWLVASGGMILLAIGNLTGGRWAAAARPYYLAQTRLVPLLAVLFIPIGLSLDGIFPWAGPHTDLHLPPSKADYLSETFFLSRAAGYWLVWLAISAWLVRVSNQVLAPGETPAMRRCGALSLVLLVPTATFAAFDWGMSLEPQWYSSIYGAILTASGVLAAHALAICCEAARKTSHLPTRRPDDSGVEQELAAVTERSQPTQIGDTHNDEQWAEIDNDLGNLLLAFMMVFAYFSFSQFLIIWSGNLPLEIVWYQRRGNEGWLAMSLVIVLLMFVVPFFLLLSRDRKRSVRRLATVAALLAVMHVVHTYWMIVPAFADTGFLWHLSNLGAIAMVAGFCLTVFLWQASRQVAQLATEREPSTTGGS